MKNKIFNIFLLIFCFLFLIYPVSYALSNLRYVFIFLLIYFFLFKVLKDKINFVNEKYYLIIILVFAILTRFGVVLLLNSNVSQVSDFKNAMDSALSYDFTDIYHRVFTHWNIYPALI